MRDTHQTASTPERGAPALETTARPAGTLPPVGVLLAAVLAISWAGPLVRFATAPALAISVWRLVLSVAVLAVIVVARGRLHELRLLDARDRALALLGGACLAAHFWTWIASLSLTSIASSVVLVNTQPVFVVALSAVFLRELPVRRQAIGIALAMAGAAIIGWGDFALGGTALLGDALALAGAVFVAAYYVIGRRLRQRLDIWNYAFVIYGIAAVLLCAVVVVHPGVALSGYPRTDWLVFLALAVGPMLIGHTGVNYALRYLPAYVANLAVLSEPVGATLIAWLLPGIGEVPTVRTVVGGVVLLAGIAIGATRARRPASRPG
jgi:drug/metabolite transporter (DMT)-like permease